MMKPLAGYVASTGKMRNACTILAGNNVPFGYLGVDRRIIRMKLNVK
jgi:hypothetical protein